MSTIIEVIITMAVIGTIINVVKKATSSNDSKETFDKIINRVSTGVNTTIEKRKTTDAVKQEIEMAHEESRQSVKELYKAGVISREEYLEYKREKENRTW